MNDTEREMWVLNDEGLHLWQRRSRLGMRQFVRQNRDEIDSYITPVVEGVKPAHHGAYPHLPSSRNY